VALRKEGQMRKLQNAFGLGETVEGQAFNRDLQEQKKLERVAEREAKEKEREKARKESEKRKKQALKEAQKAEKKAKKAAKAGKQVRP
jgi:serine/arginine repetitive matrix protein 2